MGNNINETATIPLSRLKELEAKEYLVKNKSVVIRIYHGFDSTDFYVIKEDEVRQEIENIAKYNLKMHNDSVVLRNEIRNIKRSFWYILFGWAIKK